MEIERIYTDLTTLLGQDTFVTRSEYINKMEVGDWEKWFQLELGYYFYGNHIEHWREHRYLLDGRSSLRQSAIIDFVYRRPKMSTYCFYALEIKISSYLTKSLNGMLEDLQRMSCIRQSEWELRRIYALGFFKNNGQGIKYSGILKRFTNTDAYRKGSLRLKVSPEIENDWRYIIIGWEVPGALKQYIEGRQSFRNEIETLRQELEIV